MIKVVVDLNLCQSNGECVAVAPDLFDLGEDDLLRWQEEVDDSRRAQLEDAVNLCPLMAIKLDS
jgi:ferredoxin